MPHLSPLNWVIMPTIVLMLIYTQMIYLYYFNPSTFPKTKSPTINFSHWKWN